MINRDSYLKQLQPFIAKPIIKVLTGIRRSGKSTILLLLKEALLKKGVREDQIIHINFESFSFLHLKEATALYAYIKEHLTTGQVCFVLLDEIQEVDAWEKAVNAIWVDFGVDLYITGSNSHLLSSELATHLAGRYVELPVYTLSFQEYLEFTAFYQKDSTSDYPKALMDYLQTGGFPLIHTATYTLEAIYKVVYDIYSSVILRDTVQRYKIRDVELLERVVKYAFDNIGHTFSGKNVADYFKSQQRKVDVNTVYNYLHALEGGFVLYRVSRYDIKGKELLKTQEKFYVSDLSVIYSLMGYRNRMISGLLENVVFLELKRKGYQVYIGKLEDKEIDFIAEKQGAKCYIQVAYKLESEATIEREFGSLLAIKDQYPKYVVTLDDHWSEAVEGVRHVHLAHFLLMEQYHN